MRPPVRSNKPEFGCSMSIINGKKCILFKPDFNDYMRNEMTDLLVYRAIGNGPMALVNQISKADVLQYMTTYNHAYVDKDHK